MGSCRFSLNTQHERKPGQWCRNSPAHGYRLHSITYALSVPRNKSQFHTPILQESEADRSNIFQVTQAEIRTDLPHYKPVPSPLHHYPILMVSSSTRTQPFSSAVIKIGFHHQMYVLDWLCPFSTPKHKQHFLSIEKLTSKGICSCHSMLQWPMAAAASGVE